MELSAEVNELFSDQIKEWELAGTNYGLLSKVRTRKLNLGGFEVLLQFNPGRITSSAARVDSKSIEARPCFLCSANRPQQQKGISFENDLTVLINPFPIFKRHLTIPSESHTVQSIAGNIDLLLTLARALPDFIIFYNGPQCGASAPDHLHLQAGNRWLLPVEHDYLSKRFASAFCGQKGLEIWHWSGYLRGMVTLEGDQKQKITEVFDKFYKKFSTVQPDRPEPMLNIIGYYQTGRWIIHLIPRKQHRPLQFFAEGEKQILLSPASVDLGGVIITPREEDFNKIAENDIRNIFDQVCFSDQDVLKLFQ